MLVLKIQNMQKEIDELKSNQPYQPLEKVEPNV